MCNKGERDINMKKVPKGENVFQLMKIFFFIVRTHSSMNETSNHRSILISSLETNYLKRDEDDSNFSMGIHKMKKTE